MDRCPLGAPRPLPAEIKFLCDPCSTWPRSVAWTCFPSPPKAEPRRMGSGLGELPPASASRTPCSATATRASSRMRRCIFMEQYVCAGGCMAHLVRAIRGPRRRPTRGGLTCPAARDRVKTTAACNARCVYCSAGGRDGNGSRLSLETARLLVEQPRPRERRHVRSRSIALARRRAAPPGQGVLPPTR